MSAALLVGLSGVVVGGAITAASTLVFERRREKRAELAEAKRDARELKQAARLVFQELGDAVFLLGLAVAQYKWWPYPSRTFSDQRWKDLAPILAASLDHDDWIYCAFAYEDLRDFEAKLDFEYRSGADLPPFGRQQDVEIRHLWESIQQVREILGALIDQDASNSFDTVAAMEHAGRDAAQQLMPSSATKVADVPPARAQVEVQKICEATGIAILGAPSWRQFSAALPKGLVLTVTVTGIPGSTACVLSTLGDRTTTGEFAIRFVPEEIRSDDTFEDFAFIIDSEQLITDFKELVPGPVA
jgi:hypothetical protein